MQEGLDTQQQRVDNAASAYRAAEEQLQDDLGQRLEGRFDAVRAGLGDSSGTA